MKKLYVIAIGLVSLYSSAQQTISFEASEGYTLGNINGQNNWTVTETSDGPLTNQVVTDQYSKSGIYSFKNAHVPQYQDQWFPIFGIEKSFSPALDYHNTTISYDFFAPQQGDSDFEFALYSINQEEQVFDTVLAVGFENRGFIYIFPEPNFGGFVYADKEWQTNQWYNLKVEITESTLKFYLDNELILTKPNTAKVNIDGMNFLHNNYGGDGYYDNIKINDEVLAVDHFTKEKMNVFPNPVKDLLKISVHHSEKVKSVSLYTMTGQKISEFANQDQINLNELKPGVYILNVKTDQSTYSSKIIKE